jgi:hypothetical protein
MFRSDRKTLFIIVLLHAIWFAAGMIWQHFYNGDSYEYIYLAESIGKGHYYGANPVLPLIEYRMSSRTPAYPILLLLCYTLFGKGSIAVLVVQHFLSIASCFIILKIFRKLSPVTSFSWLYLLFIAFYPAQMFFATSIVPDTLLQFFMMLYCYQLFSSLNDFKLKRLLYMGLWLVLAALTKPAVYPFILLHLLFSIWFAFRSRLKIAVVTGLIPLITLLGYGFWNQQRTGLFHMSSIQTNNLLNYNAKMFLARKQGQPYADSVVNNIKAKMETLPGLKQKYEYASHEATAIIRQNPAGYALFHLRESIRFFIEPGKSELDLFTGYLGYDFNPKGPSFYKSYRERGLAGGWNYLKSYPWLPLVLMIVLFNLLRIVGFIFFLFNKRLKLSFRIIAAIYILYFAAVTGPVANTRYFLPVLLVMSAAAALGYADFYRKMKDKKLQRGT